MSEELTKERESASLISGGRGRVHDSVNSFSVILMRSGCLANISPVAFEERAGGLYRISRQIGFVA